MIVSRQSRYEELQEGLHDVALNVCVVEGYGEAANLKIADAQCRVRELT